MEEDWHFKTFQPAGGGYSIELSTGMLPRQDLTFVAEHKFGALTHVDTQPVPVSMNQVLKASDGMSVVGLTRFDLMRLFVEVYKQGRIDEQNIQKDKK